MSLQEILAAILPTERLVYTGKNKPRTYCTFQRVLEQTAQSADDEPKLTDATYRVTLYNKGDYESVLAKIKTALRANGYYINSIDGENYETDTGYYQVPITIQLLSEV